MNNFQNCWFWRLRSAEYSHDFSQGNSLTSERKSELGIKFYSRKKCRLPGSFCHTNNPISHNEVRFLEVRFSSLENTDLGSHPCGQGSMWPCVCLGKCTQVFLADFLCDQKQKSTKRTRKLESWPTKGKAEPETYMCEKDDATQVERKVRCRGEARVKGKMRSRGRLQDLNPGFNIYKLCDLKQMC